MSPSSRISKLEKYRSAMLELNQEFFHLLEKRRFLCLKIQEFKETGTGYSSYDPQREFEIFSKFQNEMKHLSIKELLAFSLVMEDQAQAFAPGAYPSWSQGIHLLEKESEIIHMINPLILQVKSVDLFSRLKLSRDFLFLKDFSRP